MKPDILLAKAREDAAQSMMEARDEIDGVFGPNHAKNNPHLVAMFMSVTATNYQTTTAAKTAAEFLNEFSRLVENLYRLRVDLPMLVTARPKKEP
jgi:hypothetical protein